MQFFKPFSTLLVGAVLGTWFGQKLITKIRP
jgi:uncharacterized membrane protein YfcA